MNEVLERFLDHQNTRLTPEQKERLELYKRLLVERAKRLNLISSRDVNILEEQHFADSLAPLNLIPKDSKVADWGTGAGLPGVPLAIARPDIHVTLVESRQKKAAFLLKVLKNLRMTNLALFPDRGENLEENFSIITVRAIGELVKIIPLIMSKLSGDGKILFYKGPGLDKELEDAHNHIIKYGLRYKIQKVPIPTGQERLYLLLSR